MGNRIAKHVYNNQTGMLESSTYYLLDAQGNQLSVYEHVVDTATATASYYLTERNIYGSSRKDTVNMVNPSILPSYGVLGNRKYALTNHLNNVLTVINDVVYPLSEDNTTIDGYEVGISSVTDYSPFGVELDGRSFSTSKAKYGFNGMEKDNEVSGSGNSYTADFWQYSPRLGKRWNIDPVVKPWESPYAAFANNPIWFVDPSGADTTGSDAGNGGLYVLGQVDIVAKKPKNMPSREVAHAAMGFFHFLENLESLLRGSGGGSVHGGTNYYDEEGNNDQAIKGGKYTDRQPLYPLPGSIAGGAFNPEEVTKVITKEIKTYEKFLRITKNVHKLAEIMATEQDVIDQMVKATRRLHDKVIKGTKSGEGTASTGEGGMAGGLDVENDSVTIIIVHSDKPSDTYHMQEDSARKYNYWPINRGGAKKVHK